MNIWDLIIIIFILMGLAVGFKRGLTTQLLATVGLVVVVIIAFIVKDPIAEFMYKNLPFFDFGGILKGVSVLNIVVYEVIAFMIAMIILLSIFEFLMYATTIFEKLLKWTLILGLPSKIAGAIIGLIENYIIAFIVLYVFSLPTLNVNIESSVKDKILNNTPFLNSYVDSGMVVINEFTELKDKYKKSTNPNEFNKETLDLLLKYDITNVDAIDILVEKGKIKIDGINEVLDKYREEK